jgi:hypothetical protein
MTEGDFSLLSDKPKARHYIAESGKGLYRNFSRVRRQGILRQIGELPQGAAFREESCPRFRPNAEAGGAIYEYTP